MTDTTQLTDTEKANLELAHEYMRIAYTVSYTHLTLPTKA